MLFKTCSCNKNELICVKTGFIFYDQASELVHHSDLFLCARHATLSIHGANVGLYKENNNSFSIFAGELLDEGNYLGSASDGSICLIDTDLDYIQRYHNIERMVWDGEYV
jgi:hypothetical protein